MQDFRAGPLESGGISDGCSGTKIEMVRHARPFEAGGKMKIGIWFRHVRLFAGEENNPSADNQIGPSWMLHVVLFNRIKWHN